MRLPREVGIVLLAAPVVIPPVTNPDYFTEPVRQLLVEMAGNYVPAVAIWLGLEALYRTPMPGWVLRVVPLRLAVHIGLCAAVAGLASAVVYPVHLWAIGDHVPFGVYLQRNVGFTALAAVPALLLQEHRVRIREAERRAWALGQAASNAELEALKSRTQPHFLFNALNTVASLVRDDPDLAERTVHRLAGLLRYGLESARTERVTLARELEAAEAWLDVQQARFGARLRYTFDVDPEVRNVSVAPLLLQPLVENAVLHGVSGRATGGTIRVSATRVDGGLVLRVTDDGPGPGGSTHRGSGTSLADLRRRLALLHGDSGSLVTGADGGFTAELRLPIVTG